MSFISHPFRQNPHVCSEQESRLIFDAEGADKPKPAPAADVMEKSETTTTPEAMTDGEKKETKKSADGASADAAAGKARVEKAQARLADVLKSPLIRTDLSVEKLTALKEGSQKVLESHKNEIKNIIGDAAIVALDAFGTGKVLSPDALQGLKDLGETKLDDLAAVLEQVTQELTKELQKVGVDVSVSAETKNTKGRLSPEKKASIEAEGMREYNTFKETHKDKPPDDAAKESFIARMQSKGIDVTDEQAILAGTIKAFDGASWERTLNQCMGFFRYISGMFNKMKDKASELSGKKAPEAETKDPEAKNKADGIGILTGKGAKQIPGTEKYGFDADKKDNIKDYPVYRCEKGLWEVKMNAPGGAYKNVKEVNTFPLTSLTEAEQAVVDKWIAVNKQLAKGNEEVERARADKPKDEPKAVPPPGARGGTSPEDPTKKEVPKAEPGEEPGKSKPEESPETAKEKLNNQSVLAIQETQERIGDVMRREDRQILNATGDRKSSGLFGRFHRVLTGSDPYEIEIKNSKQVLGTMGVIQKFVKEAQTEADPTKQKELINKARRVLGMREVTDAFVDSDKAPEIRQRSVTGTEHFEVEQEAITVSEKVARDTIIALGTAPLGMGAAGLKGAMRVGAEMGAASAGITSTYENTVAVQEGKKTVSQAMKDVATDAAEGAVVGGAFGVVGRGIAAGGGKVAEKIAKTGVLRKGKEIIGTTVNSMRNKVSEGSLGKGVKKVTEKIKNAAKKTYDNAKDVLSKVKIGGNKQREMEWQARALLKEKGFYITNIKADPKTGKVTYEAMNSAGDDVQDFLETADLEAFVNRDFGTLVGKTLDGVGGEISEDVAQQILREKGVYVTKMEQTKKGYAYEAMDNTGLEIKGTLGVDDFTQYHHQKNYDAAVAGSGDIAKS